jgi:hypothetical protein
MRPRSLIPPDGPCQLSEAQEHDSGDYAHLRRSLKDALDELELPGDCEETVKIVKLHETP